MGRFPLALDTALKRASAIHISSPWRGILPLPDGAVTQPDRQTVPFLYSGILAAGAPVVVEGPVSGSGRTPKIDIEAWRLAYVRHRRRRLTLPRGV